jgi:hypothetical protein
MSKREWSASDQTLTHGDEASKKRSGHLIADMGHHREVICTVRFSICEPVDEDDDVRKLPVRREVPCASPPVEEDDDDRKLPTKPLTMVTGLSATRSAVALVKDPRTYSSKASRIVSPSFGILDDHDGDSVSSSVGSLERCLHTINTSLYLWSPESRNFLSEFAKNIKERKTIYWVQGLCPNRDKSLALGKRGLEGLDRAYCPSTNFNDRVLETVAERLRAKMVYCNIRDECIRDGENCMCATAEEAKRLAEVISAFAELVHQKDARFIFQNCDGKSITTTLIPKIKKVESSTPTITFVNEDSYHLSFYGYQCNRCFFTRELPVTNAIGAFLLGNYRSIGSTSTCRICTRI